MPRYLEDDEPLLPVPFLVGVEVVAGAAWFLASGLAIVLSGLHRHVHGISTAQYAAFYLPLLAVGLWLSRHPYTGRARRRFRRLAGLAAACWLTALLAAVIPV